MDVLEDDQKLFGDVEDAFQGEPLELFEVVGQIPAKQLHHHDVAGTINPRPEDPGDGRNILKVLQDLYLHKPHHNHPPSTQNLTL